MLENYFPVLIFILVGIAVGGVMLLAGRVLGRHNPEPEKLSPYECGFEAFEDARIKFDVRYYLIAILFILFDIEVAFLIPWASILKEIAGNESIRLFGFFEMLVFLGVLIVGYIYVRKRGALDWE
ncbi:NADH-quinone oxidoreductase subunit A [Niveibacterium sp.]|uniref:NADH-quinone oxidoreductase subunit A n=1 Tax=Niveibacterium sp. TaxID=2017444 RepID=UPI0035B3C0F3